MIGKTIKCISLLIVFLLVGCEEVKSENSFYGLNVIVESAFIQVYVNDAEIIKTYDFNRFNGMEDLRKYLKNGINEIVIDVAPVDSSKGTNTFSDSVRLEVSIEGNSRENGSKVDERKIHLASLTFDDFGRVREENKGVFSLESIVHKSYNLERISLQEVGDSTIRYNANAATENTVRLKVFFNVDDSDIVDPPWVNAKQIKDFSEVESLVWGKYKEAWDTINSNNFDYYVELMDQILGRTAYVTGYKNAVEVAEKVFPGERLVSPGFKLMTLEEWKEEYYDSYVSISPNGKLVSLKPNPIRFFSPEGVDDTSMNYYLCLMDSGEIEFCYQKDTGM